MDVATKQYINRQNSLDKAKSASHLINLSETRATSYTRIMQFMDHTLYILPCIAWYFWLILVIPSSMDDWPLFRQVWVILHHSGANFLFGTLRLSWLSGGRNFLVMIFPIFVNYTYLCKNSHFWSVLIIVIWVDNDHRSGTNVNFQHCVSGWALKRLKPIVDHLCGPRHLYLAI